VAASRNIIVAGAGIGGLTVALALAQRGFRVTVLEQAARLEETGAGIQLSPNATRVLIELGLEPLLRRHLSEPSSVAIKTARGGSLARIPFSAAAEQVYGAPYWAIHRGDLQAVLVNAVNGNPDIELKLGSRVEDFVVHARGVSVACRRGGVAADENGIALVAADGLWSVLRVRLGNRARPEFRKRTAWRALVPTGEVAEAFRSDVVHLWLGRNTHLVHYPVRGGSMINVVAIVSDQQPVQGWSQEGARDDILKRFSRWRWSREARALLALPERWLKWSLYDLAPLRFWGDGPATLLGDAAHPMLPFLAQGAAMAIEDAAVLAAGLARQPDDPARVMRLYEGVRRVRTARVQRAARSNSSIYHLGVFAGIGRNLVMRASGGSRLLSRYDWLYDWRPTPPHL
jgi:salicylate hydroxylase